MGTMSMGAPASPVCLCSGRGPDPERGLPGEAVRQTLQQLGTDGLPAGARKCTKAISPQILTGHALS